MSEIMTLLFRNTARHEQYYFFKPLLIYIKSVGLPNVFLLWDVMLLLKSSSFLHRHL